MKGIPKMAGLRAIAAIPNYSRIKSVTYATEIQFCGLTGAKSGIEYVSCWCLILVG
ncbi:hypothetical protein [Limnofasciculus baicalensis]|uniref:Uncharacterized protein n=1 Tax=Limnofasciculus baicalensis BBK-W-15 TaxID=2699891 RepID=A0AAE3KTN8_9CYAN|nr:hypothetical protein [Limnofasciculus baicalensis]MCP2730712.1 hypothetical protein [Limnofasciculus baicalensis BBK-W-15]